MDSNSAINGAASGAPAEEAGADPPGPEESAAGASPEAAMRCAADKEAEEGGYAGKAGRGRGPAVAVPARDPAQPLEEGRMESFARHLAAGHTAAAAWAAAVKEYGPSGYAGKPGPATRTIRRWATEPEMEARVRHLRGETQNQAARRNRLGTGDGTAMTKADLRRYLEEILLTPVGTVTESHRLAQEVTETSRESSTSTATRRVVKMPGKLEAAKQLAALNRWTRHDDDNPEPDEETERARRAVLEVLGI